MFGYTIMGFGGEEPATPLTPTNLVLTQVSDDAGEAVKIAWDAATAAVQYDIYIGPGQYDVTKTYEVIASG